MKVVRIAGALGAEIHDVDLARPLAAEAVAEIRSIWLDHGVVFFREQTLDSNQFLAFAQCIGTPVEYPFVRGLDGFPHIIEVKKLEHERTNFGGMWHTDTTYLEFRRLRRFCWRGRSRPSAGIPNFRVWSRRMKRSPRD